MTARRAAYVVLDFETTGLSPRRAEVIETGAVHVDGGRAGRTFHALSRPSRRIPARVSEVHGITDEMVREASPFSETLPALLDFLEDRVLVAHHARFDTAFLRAAAHRSGLPAPLNRVLCSVRLSRRLFPELHHHDLGSLCVHHGIRRTSEHRALEDARATAALLDLLLERAEEGGVTDERGLDVLGSLPSGGGGPRPVRLREEEALRLEEAILTGDVVSLHYLSRRGLRSHREVVPYSVQGTTGPVRLVAYDVGAARTRTFRLDRVLEIGPGGDG